MIRVFLCVMDEEFLKDMVNLNHLNDIEIVGFAVRIPKSLDFLLELDVEAIVIRDAIDVKRANALKEKIRNTPRFQHIHTIHIFKDIDGNTFRTLMQSGVINYLLEPYTAKEVLEKVKEEVVKHDDSANIARFIEEIGSRILIENGIHEHLKGFSYMKTAAFIMVQNAARITMNKVYKEVALCYDTSPSNVEKAIRLAIHHGYVHHPDCMIYKGKKPTNGETLKMMIELLKIRGMMI